MKLNNKKIFKQKYLSISGLALFLAVSFYVCPLAFAQNVVGSEIAQNSNNDQTIQNVIQNAKVETASAGLSVKVAPGEILPVSIRLLNFGGGKKVDVMLNYGIFDGSGVQIYTATETVAVETTASFVKNIQIPPGTAPGIYVAKTFITYEGQLVPATAQFTFTVENKIFGLFQSDFYLYLVIIIIVGILAGFIGHYLIKRRHYMRLSPQEYTDVPSKDRIFYEIISDTIMQMHYRVGDKAMEIAKSIEDLVIDENTGRVLQIKTDPAKIVALLILQYEKLLG